MKNLVNNLLSLSVFVIAVTMIHHLKNDREEKIAIMECVKSSSNMSTKEVSLIGDVVKELYRQDSVITTLQKNKQK